MLLPYLPSSLRSTFHQHPFFLFPFQTTAAVLKIPFLNTYIYFEETTTRRITPHISRHPFLATQESKIRVNVSSAEAGEATFLTTSFAVVVVGGGGGGGVKLHLAGKFSRVPFVFPSSCPQKYFGSLVPSPLEPGARDPLHLNSH